LGEGIIARRHIELQPDEAEALRRRTRASTVSVRDRRRSEIVLLSAEGLTQQQIAERLGISRLQVNRWVGRFVSDRVAGLRDAPGRGRKPWLAEAATQQVLERAVTPPADLGRWSCRTMARAVGISAASVQRLWAANDIKPHLSRTFKLSNDKRFEEKFWDVIGLYLDPPEKALVLCCDEKSQCQALERTQPGLPLGIGHIRTRTHDYVRHGTLTLFAALNDLDGKLITPLAARHRHQEWLAFLKLINRQSPPDLDIHIIADNYATHKHPRVKDWLQRHPRFHMHFTPTSSSWMNLVERFFGDLTPFISAKSFASTRELPTPSSPS
jgi:transposase